MKKFNKIKKTIFIVLVLLFVTIGVCGYVTLYSAMKDNKVLVSEETIKYGYTSYSRDTKLYKDTFNELKKVLEQDTIDYQKYAEYITKLFVIDFYTLNNKMNKSDVGGLQYIQSNMKSNFVLNASDTIYKYVGNIEKSPEVNSVTLTNIENNKFIVGTTEHESYKVSLSWEYKEDLGYETKGTFMVMKDEDKLYIVEKSIEVKDIK